ncbi:hypothetical protein CTI12_AA261530 (chloroplast) [Artemisia annua]|uniref:Uncharacterized protein n=1 Tax=Artemisia annua TaxID=35608 RepID=A0A2U1NE90_ARTAN|nr:hypothetical protein CTI12_AA261530 [Artemisia annua]
MRKKDCLRSNLSASENSPRAAELTTLLESVKSEKNLFLFVVNKRHIKQRRSSLLFGCEAVSNQNTQQALALPEKEVIQPHLPVRLPCYDFTPVTSPAFGIPLLAVKVTTSGMASSHSVTGGGILNALATALHGSIRTAPSIHRLRLGLLGYLIPFAPLAFVSQCQCRPSRVLSPLVFFPISTHFTAPPEIPSAPTVLQLELADAYSPDTVIASSPGKEVYDPWAFYLHAALLRQAFAHCGKFPTAASRRSLGRVSVPVWLIILSDQLLIIALLLFPSQGQVLTRYSPVRHWKHHFPSDLHVLSMPPAFILSQDRTPHEIHSCITYSFLVRRQSGFGIVFHSKA